MLSGVDKQTGQRLDDTQIRDETIIFLIAGHETTSGLLSFAVHALINHPEVLAKAYAEVDRVLGPDTSVKPTYAAGQQAHLHRSGPEGDAAAVADRARVRHPRATTTPCSVDKYPAEEALPLHRAGADAASRSEGVGRQSRGFQSRQLHARGGSRAPASMPTSRSATASAPASAASSPCRRRRWCSAWCCSASS